MSARPRCLYSRRAVNVQRVAILSIPDTVGLSFGKLARNRQPLSGAMAGEPVFVVLASGLLGELAELVACRFVVDQ